VTGRHGDSRRVRLPFAEVTMRWISLLVFALALLAPACGGQDPPPVQVTPEDERADEEERKRTNQEERKAPRESDDE
jgi:hypothetical protein